MDATYMSVLVIVFLLDFLAPQHVVHRGEASRGRRAGGGEARSAEKSAEECSGEHRLRRGGVGPHRERRWGSHSLHIVEQN